MINADLTEWSREEIREDAVRLGMIPNNLSPPELKTLGVPVQNRSTASAVTNAQNLFFYYHARPELFREFERLLNYAALRVNQPIKKIRTFSGNSISVAILRVLIFVYRTAQDPACFS